MQNASTPNASDLAELLKQATNQGCTIMVFTADTSGFAEMRVSCV